MNELMVSAHQLWDFLAVSGVQNSANDVFAPRCLDAVLATGPVDALLVLGSNDVRVAEYGARLYLAGVAPLMMFSGGFGRLTQSWTQPEAEVFAAIAQQHGVPREHIIVESQSCNTGENLRFTRALLQQEMQPKLQKSAVALKSIMLVQKPFMARRTIATAQKIWPEIAWSTAPALLDFEHYANTLISQAAVIAAMLGEVERLRDYPQKGFIVDAPLLEAVMQAYCALKAAEFCA